MTETRGGDVRVREACAHFETVRARGAFMFGGVVASELTLCQVRVRVENRRGAVADGWGAIFLSHYWAYPTPNVDHATKDRVMRRIVAAICARACENADFAHSIEHFLTLEGEFAAIAGRVAREAGASVPPGPLAALVCASPFDAALHDAFGVVNDISSYDGYGPEHCRHDLGAWLGPAFRGQYVADHLRPAYAAVVPVAHTVGGLDQLESADDDAAEPGELPATLAGWIARDGLSCFKVKLRGDDTAWDGARLRDVYAVAARCGDGDRGRIQISADLNGQCADPRYATELLGRLRDEVPAAFDALRFLEQPTPPDGPDHDMRPLAALKPVVLDEGLTGLAALDRAREHGWTGVALKTCKCHSLMLLLAVRAGREGLLTTVQDLTNPGIALVQSVGFAARLPTPLAVEANARQYYPHASEPEASVHGELVGVRGGVARTGSLRGTGFGYRTGEILRPLFAELPPPA